VATDARLRLAPSGHPEQRKHVLTAERKRARVAFSAVLALRGRSTGAVGRGALRAGDRGAFVRLYRRDAPGPFSRPAGGAVIGGGRRNRVS